MQAKVSRVWVDGKTFQIARGKRLTIDGELADTHESPALCTSLRLLSLMGRIDQPVVCDFAPLCRALLNDRARRASALEPAYLRTVLRREEGIVWHLVSVPPPVPEAQEQEYVLVTRWGEPRMIANACCAYAAMDDEQVMMCARSRAHIRLATRHLISCGLIVIAIAYALLMPQYPPTIAYEHRFCLAALIALRPCSNHSPA